MFHVKHRPAGPENAILQNNPMHQKIVLVEQRLDLVHFRQVRGLSVASQRAKTVDFRQRVTGSARTAASSWGDQKAMVVTM